MHCRKKNENRQAEAFEILCYTRLLTINWVDRVTNEELLYRVHEKRSTIKKSEVDGIKPHETWIAVYSWLLLEQLKRSELKAEKDTSMVTVHSWLSKEQPKKVELYVEKDTYEGCTAQRIAEGTAEEMRAIGRATCVHSLQWTADCWTKRQRKECCRARYWINSEIRRYEQLWECKESITVSRKMENYVKPIQGLNKKTAFFDFVFLFLILECSK